MAHIEHQVDAVTQGALTAETRHYLVCKTLLIWTPSFITTELDCIMYSIWTAFEKQLETSVVNAADRRLVSDSSNYNIQMPDTLLMPFCPIKVFTLKYKNSYSLAPSPSVGYLFR